MADHPNIPNFQLPEEVRKFLEDDADEEVREAKNSLPLPMQNLGRLLSDMNKEIDPHPNPNVPSQFDAQQRVNANLFWALYNLHTELKNCRKEILIHRIEVLQRKIKKANKKIADAKKSKKAATTLSAARSVVEHIKGVTETFEGMGTEITTIQFASLALSTNEDVNGRFGKLTAQKKILPLKAELKGLEEHLASDEDKLRKIGNSSSSSGLDIWEEMLLPGGSK
ncbi:uncharacterized protein LOC131041818 [Cryptomeria japonica]|uniref:uncharacterized protein LOC131041818 n=1 Tax=Cryptomeria japonica TaxID=3369 RepID=UPI0027D9EA63|nr:uncharacterized protein LOC131041818 [Cryptomeria japonica]XP_059065232.1 uncharacterized protein LOC131041818 [Cryptomeria japonica]